MRIWRPIVVMLCCFILSGCVPMQTNVESLMQPPKLTALQYEVDTALREAVGKDFSLKYPRNGKYKSAFNFIDISGDGTLEAIAFFSTSEEYTQVAVLTQQEGKWRATDTLAGVRFYNEVDFVSYELVGGHPLLVVGWSGTNLDNSIMAMYDYTSYDGAQAALSLNSLWDYNRMTITDIDQNGTNEVLLLVAADSYEPSASLAQVVGANPDGIIDLLAEVELPRNIIAFYPPVMGDVGNNQYGAIIDCVLNSSNLCTVALTLENGNLVLPLNGTEKNLFRQTIRTQYVLSSDVNGDGVVDIPLERVAQGYSSEATDTLYFHEFSNLVEDSLVAVQTAYVNQAKGYRFLFPENWRGQPVSAQLTPDGSEVVFFLVQNDNLYDHSKELLKIKVYSTQDGQDVLDSERYFQLAAKGSYLYSAALPSEPSNDLPLTKKQVEKLFSLL